MKSPRKSATGLSGGDAIKLSEAMLAGKTVGGPLLDKILIKALAMVESNACMGR